MFRHDTQHCFMFQTVHFFRSEKPPTHTGDQSHKKLLCFYNISDVESQKRPRQDSHSLFKDQGRFQLLSKLTTGYLCDLCHLILIIKLSNEKVKHIAESEIELKFECVASRLGR